MRKRRITKDILLLLCSLVMILFVAAVFAFAWRFFYIVNYVWPATHWSVALVFLCAVVYTVFSEILGGYKLKSSRVSELVYSHIVSSLLTAVVMYIFMWMFCRHPWPEAWPLLLCIIAWVAFSVPWARFSNKLTNKLFPPKRVVVIYGSEEDKNYGNLIAYRLVWRFTRSGSLPVSYGIRNIERFIREKRAGAVILCGVEGDARRELVRFCNEHKVYAYLKPGLYDCLISGSDTVRLNNFTMLRSGGENESVGYAIMKRVFDIIFSLFMLIITSPLMLVAAIAVKVNDGGRVIYKQKRYTVNRRVFNIYKFRTMTENSEGDTAVLAKKDDKRITKPGRWLRRTRIDELPQFVNVLLGDMSIVGPRPERPELTRKYEQEIPGFALRLGVKAGLTGYAQVYGRYNTGPMDKLAMDLIYIAQRSVFEDFRLILNTIKAIFIPENTEGITDEEREDYDREVN